MSQPTTHYQVLRSIARGGMGEVFLARQQGIAGFEREVVIKRIHASYADNPEFIKMFLQEARIAALLDHPNIVQIFELGKQERSYFIVMEYVDGLSLSRLMKAVNGPLPLPVALQIACSVAEGLQFAHHKTQHDVPLNLVHRDISPPNILLSTAGDVKLTDFGIAKVRWSVVQTEAGTVKGKYYYISPEQARGEVVDRGSDIYSLGLVLYEMTTGRRAYTSDSDTEVLNAAATGAITPPAAVVPDYPRDLERVVLRALDVDRARRYRECQELQEELMALMVSRNQVPSPAKLGQFVRSVVQRVAQPPPDPTHVDPVSELETLILSRLDSSLQMEPEVPTTLRGVEVEPATSLLQRDTSASEEPTGLLPGSDAALDQIQTDLIPVPTPGTIPLAPPPLPCGDDDPTRLDTRLPELESSAEIVTDVGREGGSPPRPSDGLPHLRLVHVVILVCLSFIAGMCTWLVMVPDRPARGTLDARAAVTVADGGRAVDVRVADLRAADVRAAPDVGREARVPDAPAAPDARWTQALPAVDVRPPAWGRTRRPKVGSVPPPQLTGPVKLRLGTDPPAMAYLGRRRLGRTPLTASVPTGALKLRFREPTLGLDAERTLNSSGTSLALRYVFGKGTLELDLPEGSLVKLDGKTLGKTPMAPVAVYEGRHVVVIVVQGRRIRRELVVGKGRRVKVSSR